MANKEWNPCTSKWKAGIEKGMDIKLKGSENVLYLGASSGTTVEQVAERTTGIVFAVEKSPKMAIQLVKLAEDKKNIAPIFCDAQNIDYIKKNLGNNKIDILFQDIPSINQIDILKKNTSLIEKNAKIFLSLKTQSISQDDEKITMKIIAEELKKDYKIIDVKSLNPFQKKHYFFILEKLLAR